MTPRDYAAALLGVLCVVVGAGIAIAVVSCAVWVVVWFVGMLPAEVG